MNELSILRLTLCLIFFAALVLTILIVCEPRRITRPSHSIADAWMAFLACGGLCTLSTLQRLYECIVDLSSDDLLFFREKCVEEMQYIKRQSEQHPDYKIRRMYTERFIKYRKTLCRIHF